VTGNPPVAGTGAGDERFFARTGPHLLEAVAAVAAAEARGVCGQLLGVAPLQTAGPQHVSFLDNRRYADLLATTQAGAVIVHPDLAARVPPGAAALVTTDPYAAWARVAALFHPPPPVSPGIHPSAVIEAGAMVDPTAEIGPNVVVGPGAVIGPRSRIGAGTVIGASVRIGADCRIGALVSISHAIVGDRVFMLPGVRVGQEGFGFAQTAQGFLSVPQLGLVQIGDDVDIGANSTIDRGSAQDTVIGAGTRIDNLVQIGHNVQVGRFCVIVAQVGISGSAVLEDFVVLAGQAGIAGHLRIGAKARVGAQAGVMADVPAGQSYVGSPAEPVKDAFRAIATLRKMSRRPTLRPGATE
jgi:UDP-3-O-[3-hydroxymyristoyl] glucosamine N-acyltransferase